MADVNSIMTLLNEFSKQRISEALGVDAEAYMYASVDQLEVSHRTYNIMRRNSCDTIGDILNLSFYDVRKWNGAGINTASELLCKIVEFVSQNQKTHGELPIVISALIDDLKEYQGHCLEERKQVEIGETILNLLPESYSKRDAITSQIEEIKNKLLIDGLFGKEFTIPSDLENMSVIPYARAYRVIEATFEIEKIIEAEDRIIDLKKYYNSEIDKERINRWKDFFRWLLVDINAELHKLFLENEEERIVHIVKRTVDGATLEEIGQELNVTRERVRQIRNKYFIAKQRIIKSRNYILWLYAYSSEYNAIKRSFLDGKVGAEPLSIFWYMVRQKMFDEEGKWLYSGKFDAIVFRIFGSNNLVQIEDIITAFPDELDCDEMDQRLIDAVEKYNSEMKYLVEEVGNQFYFYNEFYSRRKYNLSEMCSYILKNKFAMGYRAASIDDFERFCECLNRLFNYNTSDVTQRSLNARIVESAFLCDKGTYRHKSYMKDEGDISAVVSQFVDEQFENGRTALSYKEVFEGVKDYISEDIENPFMLHGMMSNFCFGFIMTKDYVLKEIDSSFDDDFVNYIKSNYPISVDKVINHFSLAEPQIQQLIARCSRIEKKGSMLLYRRK